ncbi:hypothetical protein GCM10009858_42880 [Terrabacter carboxydivorans]|uniref:Uncharacterized protein n=1 Tax=Terrabacter carboxydivorans TaxID=619730 RepID=A0ABP5ZSK9_9MICO
MDEPARRGARRRTAYPIISHPMVLTAQLKAVTLALGHQQEQRDRPQHGRKAPPDLTQESIECPP